MAADRPEAARGTGGEGSGGEGSGVPGRARPAEGEIRWEHPPSRGFWTLLTDDERAAFREMAREHGWRSGEVIYHEGQTTTDVSVMRRGWAKVVASAGGADAIVALRGTGDVVGEWAALTGRPRSATVIALEGCETLTVSGERFRDFLRRNPHADAVLRRHVAERLTDRAGRQLTYESINEAHRMAWLMLELAQVRGSREENGAIRLTLPLTRRDLAQWVGASPAAVSSALADWRRNGIVRTGRGWITLIDTDKLERLTGVPAGRAGPGTGARTGAGTGFGEPGRPWAAAAGGGGSLHCSILVVDVVGFGDRRRDEAVQRFVRDQMYLILHEAFDGAGVPWAREDDEDRGDGVLYVIPPTVSVVTVLDPVLTRLRAGLRRHNRLANEDARIRMRAAVHAGMVHGDAKGVSGLALIEAFRLLAAPVLKEVFTTTEADLAWLVSDHLYQSVVRHGPELIDPATYQPVRVAVKDFEATAWLHVPDHLPRQVPLHPAAGPLPTAPRPAGRAAGTERAAIVVYGDISVAGDVVAGDKHVHGGG